jgi:hypothetical protein
LEESVESEKSGPVRISSFCPFHIFQTMQENKREAFLTIHNHSKTIHSSPMHGSLAKGHNKFNPAATAN